MSSINISQERCGYKKAKMNMKLTLIYPSMGKILNEKYVKSWQMQPLSIAVIAGLTPNDIDITFYDDRLDEIPYDDPTDLVAISVETYTAKRAYTIADEYRKRGIPVVMGGMQASLIPEEVSQHADATVVGDAEPVWQDVLEDAKNNQLQTYYRTPRKNGLLTHTRPDRTIYQDKNYLSLELIEAGRGCPFACDFCAIAGSYHQSYRMKTIDDIVNEVGRVDGKNLFFVDDNFISKSRQTKELCHAIAPLNKKWFSHGSINMTNDDELLDCLAKSGCANILIGFESLNPKVLQAMGKSWNIAKRDYSEAIQKLRDRGITIYATFVFGYDDDTEDDIKRTFEFAVEQKFCMAAFNHLVPFPGTPLYDRLKKDDRLINDKWWLTSGQTFGDVFFKPTKMSAETLAQRCYECRQEYYSYHSIFKRSLDFKANCNGWYQSLIYFITNHVSRKGILQRQGWPIGDLIGSVG